jgi:hypothetical protein
MTSLPTLAPFTTSFEEEEADRVAAAWDMPDAVAQLWSESTNEGVVIGISAGADEKLSLVIRQPEVVAAFAHRLLEACVEDCRESEEVGLIRQLVLTNEDHSRLLEKARSSSKRNAWRPSRRAGAMARSNGPRR